VLGISRLTSTRSDYYLSDLATELPAAGDGPPGAWLGQGCAAAGWNGAVDRVRLEAALAGSLHQGRPLRGRVTNAGYDLTFSAPKSASVLYALGGEEVARQVLAGQVAAVVGAVGYLESHALSVVRRRGDEQRVLPTGGMIAAGFTHGVSRTHDPHLHTHLVVANLAQGEDGRWSALDQRALWAHREAASAVYDAHLRHELTTRLGVRWTQAPQAHADVVGVSPLLLGEFGSRGAYIRRQRAAWGVRSGHGAHVAWAATRPAKEPARSFASLSAEWSRRADALGAPHLAPVLGHRPPEQATLNEHAFASVLSDQVDGVHRRDVVAAFAHGAQDGVPAGTVQQLADASMPAHGVRPVGVAETRWPRVMVEPSGTVLRELGPRPLDPSLHAIWRQAAQTIEGYRARWGVRDRAALGDGGSTPSWSTARLVDHLQTVQALDTAQARLGRRAPRSLELERGR
jgi:conjugative relaxase-like TrwC/TraI family protein